MIHGNYYRVVGSCSNESMKYFTSHIRTQYERKSFSKTGVQQGYLMGEKKTPGIEVSSNVRDVESMMLTFPLIAEL